MKIKETTHLQPRNSTRIADKGSNGRFDPELAIIKLLYIYGSVERAHDVFRAQVEILHAAPPEQWPDEKWPGRVGEVLRMFGAILDEEREWFKEDHGGYYYSRRSVSTGTGVEGWKKRHERLIKSLEGRLLKCTSL